jgi:hypothetical protein
MEPVGKLHHGRPPEDPKIDKTLHRPSPALLLRAVLDAVSKSQMISCRSIGMQEWIDWPNDLN